MPNAIRLCLDPLPTVRPMGLGGEPATISGVQPRFALFGGRPTTARKDVPQPARIELFGSFSKFEPKNSQPLETSLAVLEGQLRLRGTPLSVAFACDPASLEQLRKVDDEALSSSTGSEPPKRALDLALDPAVFEVLTPSELSGLQILLPQTAEQYDYLHVYAELTVAGNVEAGRDLNDILDVPVWAASPPRARRYEVQVVDEVGKPLQGVDLVFDIKGQPVGKTTNPDGVAYVYCSEKSETSARLATPDSLTPDLQKRWSKVRGVPELSSSKELVERAPKKLGETFGVATTKRSVLCIRPPVELARMRHMYFDSEKCFLLPPAIDSMKRIVSIYTEHPKSQLLVVGHTDTTGAFSYNETLSLERAQSMAAYLKNDVAVWTGWYSESKSEGKRWGAVEDGHMIATLARFFGFDASVDSVNAYQMWHNQLVSGSRARNWASLKEDGKAGTETRAQLVGDYMNIQGTSLPSDVSLTSHGCGEYFPLDALEMNLDEDPEDEMEDQGDRRVELFFFDEPFGIQPIPPKNISGKASLEYPEWVRRARFIHAMSVKPLASLDDFPFSV